MIYIDRHSPSIQKAFENHISVLTPKVQENRNNSTNIELRNFLNDLRIKKILSDPPELLLGHHNNLLTNLTGYSPIEWEEFLKCKVKQKKNRTATEDIVVAKYKSLADDIGEIFNYTGQFANKSTPYSAYDLAKNLNFQTCIYCNRIYTKTVKNPSKITRPEFDHWFPKSSYPILALSFYNLIPSCHICNSGVKGSTKMDPANFIHPYMDESIDYKFSFWIEKYDEFDFKIDRVKGSKEDNTIEAFQIEKIYETHRDEIYDLVKLKKLYSVDYLIKLKNLLSEVDSNISMQEIYRLAFGTHYRTEDFHKRPLSKMKKDILTELNMILE